MSKDKNDEEFTIKDKVFGTILLILAFIGFIWIASKTPAFINWFRQEDRISSLEYEITKLKPIPCHRIEDLLGNNGVIYEEDGFCYPDGSFIKK